MRSPMILNALAVALGVVAAPVADGPCVHPAVPKTMVSGRTHMARTRRPYATVTFNLDATGAVESVALAESTGDKGLDADALSAAKRWTFVPATDHCRPIPTTVTFTVGFGYGSKTFADPCNHNTEMLLGVVPEYPDSAARANLPPSSVAIKLEFDEEARLVGIGMLQSSGFKDIDNAATGAALVSAYSGTVKQCVPVGGSYGFRARFDPTG